MTTADTVYTATLDEPIGARELWSRLLWPVRLVAAGLGVVDETVLGAVVVRRRDDGSEVMRIDVSGSEESAQLLSAVRAQLAEQTVEEFHDTWDVTGP